MAHDLAAWQLAHLHLLPLRQTRPRIGRVEEGNTVTDFDANGNDKIQIDSNLEGLVSITGQGTNKITISLSGAQTGTTTVESGGQTIDDDDIEFV